MVSRRQSGAVDTASDPSSGSPQVEDLLHVALSRPREAVARAEALLRADGDPRTASIARQTLGIVLRDRGESSAALTHLRAALRLAERTGEDQRVADVLATYGAALVMAGSTRRGFTQLDHAADLARGETLARVRMRRAYLLTLTGSHEAALTEIRRALEGIRRTNDPVWEARALNNRALIHMALGRVAPAERDITRAHDLYQRAGQDLEVVFAIHNRGVVAFLRNDIPEALRLYDVAAGRYDELGAPAPSLAVDRCAALLTAGLAADGVFVIEQALAAGTVQPSWVPDLTLQLATARLSSGDPDRAREDSARAATLFAAQRRHYGRTVATLTGVQASYAAGLRDGRLLSRAASVSADLEALDDERASAARLLAGRLALHRGRPEWREHLTAAARFRRGGTSLARLDGRVAQALLAAESGDTRRCLAACARGLDELDDLCATFGSLELRALSTAHGAELAEMALRHAADRGDVRMMLRWSERWRATALGLPAVRPTLQPVSELAALRDATRRLEAARAAGAPTASIERERSGLERAIRAQQHRVKGAGRSVGRFDLDRLRARLGATTFVEVVEIGATLHALVVTEDKLRRFEIGPARLAIQRIGHALFTIHGLSRGVPLPLGGIGQAMEDAVLGRALVGLGRGPVVISPPARLHSAPWGLMPSLTSRPVGVTPSAALWMRAASAVPPPARRVVLVAGPRLRGGEEEVARLSRRYPSAVVLHGEDATVDRVLGAIDGAWLVHLAAHGTFRPDNPLFSSMRLYDGPMTVHDLQRIERPPYRLLLSACDSGVAAPAGAEELLGFASAVIGLGTAGVASSVSEVNDLATVPFMLDVHEALNDGSSLSEAMSTGRVRAGGTPLGEATSAAFTTFGV